MVLIINQTIFQFHQSTIWTHPQLPTTSNFTRKRRTRDVSRLFFFRCESI